ncbi:MAG TPA: response regulator, partial [Accumulibacter sp.]|nr:response regulator [Accumulibacter sp.]
MSTLSRSPALTEPSASLLLVDDDPLFCRVLARALERRGFAVSVAGDVAAALVEAEHRPPTFAVIDLKMPGESGLVLIEKLLTMAPGMRVVMLTGYASIATAVEAIKLGAVHYLAKPCDADQVVEALLKDRAGDARVAVADSPLSVDRLEWEHIQRVLSEQQ